TDFFEHAEYVCTVIFLIELGLRIWVYRSNFFTDRRERAWNLFDSFLVSISVIDAVVNLSLSVGGKQVPSLQWPPFEMPSRATTSAA
ncbi:unnamed protein product, partial [Prorocentrum cordatum]